MSSELDGSPTVGGEDPTGGHLYSRHCRPKVATFLEALGLDVEYVRAEGNTLYYRGNGGALVPVLDFLGGYGSLLFGHNHPRLVDAATDALRRRLPFAAQASCRGPAGRLGARLNGMFRERFGRDFVTTFTSTGAEAVEAAMKHAVLARKRRLDALDVEFRRLVADLRRGTTERRYRPQSGESLDDVIERARTSLDAALASRAVFLSLEGAFHGKTTGATALCHYEGYRDAFEAMLPDVRFVSADDAASVDRAAVNARLTITWPQVDDSGTISLVRRQVSGVAALFVEPIQGEGGIRVISQSFLRHARVAADREQFPLVFDEIQCGMGRTGTFLFSEQQAVEADYYTLAKSLGGGIAKIAAFLVRADKYDEEFGLIQTSTFAEDDPGATIALAALDLLEDAKLIAACAERGTFILSELRKLAAEFPDVFASVRGVGLMIGVELAPRETGGSAAIAALSSQDVLGYAVAGYLLKEHGLRVGPCLSNGHVLRIEPSALVTPRECEALLSGFRGAAETLRAGDIHALTRHLVASSSRYETPQGQSGRRPVIALPQQGAHVGFIGYFVEATGLVDWDPGYSAFQRGELESLIGRTWKALDPVNVGRWPILAPSGESITLSLYGLPIDSKHFADEMRTGRSKLLKEKIDAAVAQAKADGCSLVGFGGFTSIVTNNCREVDTLGVGLTTGNSLTVGMGLEVLFAAAERAGIIPATATFAAVGARGNIGSVYCELVAEHVPRLILVARPGREGELTPLATRIYARALARLRAGDATDGVAAAIRDSAAARSLVTQPPSRDDGRRLFGEVSRELGGRAPIAVMSDLGGLREASLILGASNAATPVILPEHIGNRRVVICDLAVPSDVSPVVKQLKHVTCVNGGTVRLPANPDFRAVGLPLPAGHVYACMAETIVLGMAQKAENFSIGAVMPERVAEVVRLAKTFGFRPASPQDRVAKPLHDGWSL